MGRGKRKPPPPLADLMEVVISSAPPVPGSFERFLDALAEGLIEADRAIMAREAARDAAASEQRPSDQMQPGIMQRDFQMSAVAIQEPTIGLFGDLAAADAAGRLLLPILLAGCTGLDAAAIGRLTTADALALATEIVEGWQTDIPLVAFWRARLGQQTKVHFDKLHFGMLSTLAMAGPDAKLARLATSATVGQPDEPIAPSTRGNSGPTAPLGMLNSTDLAKRHGVNPGALRKRLERWRATNKHGWIEAPDGGGRKAAFLYQETAVRAIIDEMKTSVERPSK